MNPIPVIVESPYSSTEKYTIEQNVEYALKCMKHSYMNGEAPILTHLLYTRIPTGYHVSDYDVNNTCMGREYALNCAHEWRKITPKTILYTDHGISQGMIRAEQEALKLGKIVEKRSIY